MPNDYSELEKGFYFAPFDNSLQEEVQKCLKHEVGLVQGARQTRAFSIKNDCEENIEAGGDSNKTKIITAKGWVSKRKKFKDKEVPIQQELKRLFNRFCFQLGIHRLPEDFGDFGRQHASGEKGRRRTKGSSNNDQGGSGGGKESTDRPNHRKSSKKSLKTGGAGGGDSDDDEGKYAPKMSSSSLLNIPTSSTEVSESTEPSTANISSSISTPGRRSDHRHNKKRRTRDVSNQQLEASHVDGEIPGEETLPKVENDSQSKPKRSTVVSFKSRKTVKEPEADVDEHPVEKAISFSQVFQSPEEPNKKHHHHHHHHRKSTALKPKKSLRSFSRAARGTVRISSLTDIEVFRLMGGEKGDEWLEWSSSEDEARDEDDQDMEKARKNHPETERPIQPDLQTFMESTKMLDRLNNIMGLNPYSKVVRSNHCVQVKWVPRSLKYFAVCFNALVFFMTTLSMFCSLLTILRYEAPLSATQQIVQLDFAHHFMEGTFLMLLIFFLTIWAVSCILELGVSYAEFYSRFNMGIVLTKYDLSEGIREMIVKHLATVLLFEMAIVLLFLEGYVHTSIVRESCGFLGYTILRPFYFELRESNYYPLVEIFGLLAFLHFFLTVNVILLHFIVHAKALGNMAKHFNLRLAYVFGTLTEKGADGVSKHVKKVIPFKKLWAEHQIVTSLFRHFSQVNSVVFGAFIFTMVCEIVLCMWLFFDIFLEDHPPELEGISIDRTGKVDLAVPLRLQKTEGERLMKAFVIFSITWLMYWIFVGVLHNAGDALHIGMEYVRRYGLIRCKNSKQIRFVLSMMTSFTPKTPFWIGRKFQFSRAFFVALTSLVVGASMVVVAFRPERLDLTTIEFCNHKGFCRVITVYVSARDVVYATLNVDPTPPATSSTIVLLPVFPTDPDGEAPHSLNPLNTFLQTAPCESHGAYPIIESTVSGIVYTEWSFPLSRLKLPFLYEQKFMSDPSAWPSNQYKLFDSRTTAEYTNSSAVNCYGKILLNPPQMDDCQNPSFATPKRGDWLVKFKEPPEKQLIALNQIPGFPDPNDERFFCCYNYAASSDDEVRACNLPNKAALDSRCVLSSTFGQVPLFIDKLKRKRNTAGNRDDLASDVPFSDPIRTRWTNCVCKQDVGECKKLTSSGRTPPPATTTSPITKTTKPPPRPAPCFKYDDKPDDKKYFRKCRVPPSTRNNHINWSNLYYILYPTVFQLENGQYRQGSAVKSYCDPDANGDFLPFNSVANISTAHSVFDCKENEYLGKLNNENQGYFEDECFNPIFFKSGTRWNTKNKEEKLKIRVTILDATNKKVACCIDYELDDPNQSRQQALVCNQPTSKSRNEHCGKPFVGYPDKVLRPNCTDRYINKWYDLKNPVSQSEFESNDFTVWCLCQDIEYVKKFYPKYPQKGLADCHTHIKDF